MDVNPKPTLSVSILIKAILQIPVPLHGEEFAQGMERGRGSINMIYIYIYIYIKILLIPLHR